MMGLAWLVDWSRQPHIRHAAWLRRREPSTAPNVILWYRDISKKPLEPWASQIFIMPPTHDLDPLVRPDMDRSCDIELRLGLLTERAQEWSRTHG